MPTHVKTLLYRLLRWSERYTKTDMVYLASGQFWLVLGRIVGAGSGLVLTYVFANFLDPTTFGTYKYILAIAGIVSAFTLSGLGGAVTRAVAKGMQHVVPSIARTNMYWSLPASFCALAVALYYYAQGNDVLGFGILLIAITTPLASWVGLYKNVMIGKKDFKNLALSSFRSLVPVAGLICAVLFTQNIFIIFVAYFGLNLLVSSSMHLWTLRRYRITERGADSGDIADTKRYGAHLSVMSAISQASDHLDQLLIWHFAGPLQLAIYSLALAPIRELRNFSQNIYPLIFPKFVTKSIAEMKATAPLRMRQLAFVFGGAGFLYILAAPMLYHYLFPQYTDAIFPSQLLALGLVLQAKGIVDTMLYVQANSKLRYIAIIGSQGVKVALWVALIPLYGMIGAVVGIVVADAISAFIFWWAYRRLS